MTGTSSIIDGWGAELMSEFDRRWLRGDLTREIAAAFKVSTRWVQEIRRRRGLPPRPKGHGRSRYVRTEEFRNRQQMAAVARWRRERCSIPIARS